MDAGDLANPDFDPWRLVRQPGTSHEGWTEWETVSDSQRRVVATDEQGTRRVWLVTVEEAT
jgi:hypothetical protein